MKNSKKIKIFENLMNDAYRALQKADNFVDGSSPVQELMEKVDETTEEVVNSLELEK